MQLRSMSGVPFAMTDAQVLAHEIPSAVREIATIDGLGGIYDRSELRAFLQQREVSRFN